MNFHRRRHLTILLAVLATIAMAAKIYKAVQRGEVTQSRVRTVN